MDFELSDDQVALTEGIRALCEGRFGIEDVRAMADSGGIDRGRWTELAETGVFGLALAEADGGVGLGWADTTLVFEELGRHLVPGPLVGATLAAGLVDGVIDGTVVPGIIERHSRPTVVEHFSTIDTLLILDETGVYQVDPSTIDATVHERPLDPLTPVASSEKPLPQGAQIADAATAELWRVRGTVLSSAFQLGLADAATASAVGFAKERQQFGKPIGAFQAVKHLCADMTTHVEVARAAVYQAGVALDDPEVADPAIAASTARIVASEAGSTCGKNCVQVHGGMGYTWEVDAHLYLKRTWVYDHTFGDRDDHAELIAQGM